MPDIANIVLGATAPRVPCTWDTLPDFKPVDWRKKWKQVFFFPRVPMAAALAAVQQGIPITMAEGGRRLCTTASSI